MSITRHTLRDEIDRLDAEITERNRAKSDCFDAYRQHLKDKGRAKEDVAAEIVACKKAFRRLRALDKDADAVLEQDALVDEIVAELQAPARTGTVHALARAPRTTPAEAIPNDAGATGSPRHVAEPAPSTCPPPAPGAGSSFAEPDPRDDIRNQPFYRGAVS